MRRYLALLAAIAAVNASPVAMPQAVTSAIKPSAAAPSGCMPDYSGTFGVAVMNVTAGGGQAVSQKTDGQPQATSSGGVKQTSDGQPQVSGSAAPVSQKSDGQPQASTGKMTAAPISQISDGQIQATSKMTMMPVTQISDGQIQGPKTTMMPVGQISDGQIQNPTKTMAPVSQISDGQIQASTATGNAVKTLSDGQPQATTATGNAVKTISDGQPQATTATGNAIKTISDGQPQATTATGSAVKTISDGQPQASSSASASGSSGGGTQMVACKSSDSLQLTLAGGILKDNQGRIGYIASNYQFQFDGPPQAGAIYTAGWSVCGNGSLALGGSSVFYQCLSGNFYNLYDRHWAAQCNPVTINVLELISCS